MNKHNYLIANKTASIKSLADYIYGGANEGFHESFLKINQPAFPEGYAVAGETLYLPSEADDHQSSIEDLALTITKANVYTRKSLGKVERYTKVLNHRLGVLRDTSTEVGVLSGMALHRMDRMTEIMNEAHDEVKALLKRQRSLGTTAGTKSAADEIWHDAHRELSMEMDGFGRSAFSISLYTREKIHKLLRIKGKNVVDSMIKLPENRENFNLAEFIKFSRHLDSISKIIRGAGYVGIGIGGIATGGEIVGDYKKYGWSNKFGASASNAMGNYFGSVKGGRIGTDLAKKFIKVDDVDKLLKKGKGLLRSVVTSSGDGIAEDAAFGTAEEVGVDALIGVTAVAEAPLVALAVSTALVIGVGYLVGKYGGELAGIALEGIYDGGADVIHYVEKEVDHWL